MEKSIGALWEKVGKNGKKYLSGKIELVEGQQVSIVIFDNNKGGVETRPDKRIFRQGMQADANNPTPGPTVHAVVGDSIPF